MSAGWKAGVAKVDITPEWPVYMMGYGFRTQKHDEVLMPIYARALALEAADGTRAVLLSLELLGTSNEMTAAVQEALKAHGVAPAAVRLTSTHTHSAPSLSDVYCGCCQTGWISIPPKPEDTSREDGIADIAVYTDWAVARIIEAATEAIGALQPVVLERGCGSCDIAVNRRNNDENEVAAMAEAGTLDKSALNGPFDWDVELLVARRPADDTVVAVSFGYSCHATVLAAQSLHGDWPGRAMATLEAAHPELLALHINGCSGDSNPLPRRSIPLMEQYGDAMAAAVTAAALADTAILEPLAGGATLSCVAMETPLRYHTLPTEEELVRTRDTDTFFA